MKTPYTRGSPGHPNNAAENTEALDLDLAAEVVEAERHATKIVLATAVSFVLSTWLTAKGLFDAAVESGTASVEGMVTAFMAAVVSSTLLGVSTFLFFRLVTKGDKR